MPICKDLKKKYLKDYAGGIEIVMDRKGVTFKQKLPYRMNGGMNATLSKAIEIRDSKHIELYGFPISQGFFHIKSKSQSTEFPSGISIGYSRGAPIYIVSSWMCRTSMKVKRKRFNIKSLGYQKALSEAIANREKMIQENYIDIKK
jgi:hypothetical protein